MFYQYVCTLRAKPHRPYKCFFDFCREHGADAGNPYPCLACRGKGQVPDPREPPDPVEGYRYANYINCPECESSGKGTQAACGEAYRASLQEYRRQKSEFERLAKARKEALRTLTKEQIQALRELGV